MDNDSKVMMGVDLATGESQSFSLIFEIEDESVEMLESGPVRVINKMKPLAVSLMPFQQEFLDHLQMLHEFQFDRFCIVPARQVGRTNLLKAIRDSQRPVIVDEMPTPVPSAVFKKLEAAMKAHNDHLTSRLKAKSC